MPQEQITIKKNRIAIVGSGPSAAAAHMVLSKSLSNISMEIIDIGAVVGSDGDVGALPTKLKGHRGDFSMYRFPFKSEKFRSKFPFLLSSQSMGGFTQVWGGSTSPTISEFGVPVMKIQSDKFDSFKILPDKLEGFSVIKKDTYVTVEENNCTKCGQCLLGCQFSAIWGAREYWLNQLRTTYRSGIKVSQILQRDSRLILLDDNSKVIGAYDYIFLAAGALGSLDILMNSKIIDCIEMGNSDMVIIPFLAFKSIKNQKNELSVPSYSLEISKNTNKISYMQIYTNLGHVKAILEKNNILIRAMPQKIWEKISKYLGVAFVYHCSHISRSIRIKTLNNEVIGAIIDHDENRALRNQLNRLYKSLFLSNGFVPLLLTNREEPFGRSFHVGSIDSHGKESSLIDLLRMKGIICVDGLALTEIKAGPFVDSLMENAAEITRTFVADLK